SLSQGETGIVVTHGACLKVGLLGLLGLPASQAVTLRGMANCHWAALGENERDGPLRLEAYDGSVDGRLASHSPVG
ncbi:MAG: hypothetical protein ABI776_18685, partial [Nocardioidaceae bacterium]